MSAVTAGIAYFAIVFGAGFVFGGVRVLYLLPAFGPVAALFIELPVMLLISWIACAVLVDRLSVASTLSARLAMGGVAFALLMAAELLVSVFLFGRSVDDHLRAYATWSAKLGLAAQLAFGVFPVLQMRRSVPAG
jgi:hypothetical protein